jgi:hypothetical protein
MAVSDCLILAQTVTDCCGFFRACCVIQEPRSRPDRLIQDVPLISDAKYHL